jgi:membrane associated rhomboid family serine protease
MAWASSGRKRFGGLGDLPGACPITWAVIGVNLLTFLAAFVRVGYMEGNFAFDAAGFLARPWTAVTYLLVAPENLLSLLLSAYVFWLFSGSLERSWGSRDYLVFLLLITAAPALALWVALLLTGVNLQLIGLWLPVSATVVAWATINPHERVMLYFVIPLEARWLALLAGVLVFFNVRFPFGIFALAGCGVAWWYAQGGKYRLWALGRGTTSSPKPRLRTRRFTLNPLDALQRWRRKRQFARLLKRSGLRDLDS